MLIPVWAITTFGAYLLTSLIGSVWWASNIATTLNFMREAMNKMEKSITNSDINYAAKTEVAKDFANRDRDIEAIWKKLDKLEDTVNEKKTGG